jgi:hypothetical protein
MRAIYDDNDWAHVLPHIGVPATSSSRRGQRHRGVRGSLTLADSTISGNAATKNFQAYGGGIFASGVTVTVTGSTISGNSTTRHGGGVFVGGGTSLKMTDSTVSGNTAPWGYGGGLYLTYSPTSVIRNSTIAYNAALIRGGIYGGSPVIDSTIVANYVGGTGPDLDGRVTATFSLIGDTSRVTLDPASANNLLNRDPLLGPLADNGGPTPTHALLVGSPAINAGSNPANLRADQRGAGGDFTLDLHRLYGDANGDKAVNGLDLTAFRNAFGAVSTDAAYVPFLDFDGDGAINGTDLTAFRTRFGVILP